MNATESKIVVHHYGCLKFIDIDDIEVEVQDLRSGANDHGGYVNFTLSAEKLIEAAGIKEEDIPTTKTYNYKLENFVRKVYVWRSYDSSRRWR